LWHARFNIEIAGFLAVENEVSCFICQIIAHLLLTPFGVFSFTKYVFYLLIMNNIKSFFNIQLQQRCDSAAFSHFGSGLNNHSDCQIR
jgi:hypothetical protein